MARIALGLEYDGTDFVGWQAQRNGRSVQSVVSQAVAKVADEPVTLHACGRTDAGVHAIGQVAHFDTGAVRTARQWTLGINSHLPDDVSVHWAKEVPPSFDARRSAVSRRYRYALLESPTRPALARRRAWWIRGELDCAVMTAAAVHWLGEHDFSAFRAAGCQSRTPMRRLSSVAVQRDGPWVLIDFTANAFLLHMVRNLVGTLVAIGRGKATPDWAATLLESRDRTKAAETAPAQGLTLLEARYPARYEIPLPPQRGSLP